LIRPLRAVLFDVDFTLCKPGPLLGPEGYRRAGARQGLALEPELYDEARAAAIEDLKHHPELEHDEQVWIRFTEDIIRGMGGEGSQVSAVALEIVRAWEHSANFELYEDAPPVLRELRRQGLKIGLVSNTSRDLARFVDTFSLDVDAWIASGVHGKVKPSPSIFLAILDQLSVAPAEAAMVGDSVEDDVEGAQSLGMRAFLLDREGRFPARDDTLPDLYALPSALGTPAATRPEAAEGRGDTGGARKGH
jgi:putative hydrolase of the HAD superfamily